MGNAGRGLGVLWVGLGGVGGAAGQPEAVIKETALGVLMLEPSYGEKGLLFEIKCEKKTSGSTLQCFGELGTSRGLGGLLLALWCTQRLNDVMGMAALPCTCIYKLDVRWTSLAQRL